MAESLNEISRTLHLLLSASVGKFVPTGQEDFDEVTNSQMRKVIAKD